ncbi:FK506-binding protein 2 [Coccidioides immitis RS]|uniref:peptidylprolyl isomerase n=5 Tax=Coccidioides TaxID=5500 RepID=A0A0E1RYD7_COCIM|nr:FK506-binding protein 2 [Coccidioides immitis RS]EFW21844.1 FKBP-type peptidyl-prolyl isomerase [Coccidioides posadasii str. Silveira]KMM65302.1 FK506-binding protein 2 [Coccidioides posadasii RMSCC 3488]KMP01141.1 FK506-binding protein 2 [Coccidioides immitis RMSCC 2394]KMU83645.1 FK506-binding protein 2 [Coccidioides immitis H538.4]TPX25948.1 hypothetical protein DIZ76_011406 [Coccidioides immitis]
MRLLSLFTIITAVAALECADLVIELTHRETCSRPTQAGDTIKIHYRGTFTNGTEFDSSIGQEPLEFPLGANKVIRGFDEGARNMCVGDKRKITIPPLLGYGDKQKGPIPPSSTLIFETELVEIVGVPNEGN